MFESNTLPPIAHLTGEMRSSSPYLQLPPAADRPDPIRGHHPSQSQGQHLPHVQHPHQSQSTHYWSERGEWYQYPRPPPLVATQSHGSHPRTKNAHRSHPGPHPYQRTQSMASGVGAGGSMAAHMGSDVGHLRPPSHPNSRHYAHPSASGHSAGHTAGLPSPAYTTHSGERHIPLPIHPSARYAPGRGTHSAPTSTPASTPASASASASAAQSRPTSGNATPQPQRVDPALQSGDDHSSDSDSSDDEDEWTPVAKRRAPAPRTRASARLAVKRERDDSELREVEDEEEGPSASTSPIIDGKPKKRTYVRRDAQRRKEQNAQAQKKFRWKKKVLQEQMRADLDEQRALVEELREKCAALEDLLGEHEVALAAAQEDNARLAARLEGCACE
ncbi:hypothetical protein CC85DRAFT_322401 [Cutaneotrichosporon oleaginosum]|uniref:BZIP domain-containing protein n=1 Tax=Cutaneotrichosporon oleaginosum TaxID=879819 RepID=A0A0J0XFT8_9TREE|nr:uncharacterized protein CC85DRAFT_322401 [Cutaneotrichosporon oleaginosum]KLT39935.1 hypothetical protein CC85DRAFT_322401 [Cutaneotrichosporon oleaginosum]TXT08349.1 hypothetical protein COLE_05273 [Cutaneotrichosporon oleaginosum]